MPTPILIPLNSPLRKLLRFFLIFLLMPLIWDWNRSGWKCCGICVWISGLRNFFASTIMIPFDCPKRRRFFLWFPLLRNRNRPWGNSSGITIVYSSSFKAIPASRNGCSLVGNSLEKRNLSNIVPLKVKFGHLLFGVIIVNLKWVLEHILFRSRSTATGSKRFIGVFFKITFVRLSSSQVRKQGLVTWVTRWIAKLSDFRLVSNSHIFEHGFHLNFYLLLILILVIILIHFKRILWFTLSLHSAHYSVIVLLRWRLYCLQKFILSSIVLSIYLFHLG